MGMFKKFEEKKPKSLSLLDSPNLGGNRAENNEKNKLKVHCHRKRRKHFAKNNWFLLLNETYQSVKV